MNGLQVIWDQHLKCTKVGELFKNVRQSSLNDDAANSIQGFMSLGTSCKGRKRHSMTIGKLHRGEMLDLFSDSPTSNNNSLSYVEEDIRLRSISHQWNMLIDWKITVLQGRVNTGILGIKQILNYCFWSVTSIRIEGIP
jgi:hypothetical protein